jgi:toxin HigB-1
VKISFTKNKMAKICSSESEMRRTYGSMARKLMQRLEELRAAEALSDISHLPPARLHELTGDRAGQFSVDLDHPYRLLFKPDHDPVPTKDDGGVDKEQVTEIVIVDIADTH